MDTNLEERAKTMTDLEYKELVFLNQLRLGKMLTRIEQVLDNEIRLQEKELAK